MWLKFCDFSYDQPNPVALKAAGFDGVLMYLSRTPGKGMTGASAKRFLDAGLIIGALYETAANAALGGKATGEAQARDALAIGADVGYPVGCVIIYALDQDYSTAQMAGPVSQFVEGLHAVAGPDGEYGGYGQLQYLIAHKLADNGALFQTYAWSGGKWLPTADAPLEQYQNGQKIAGGTVDFCRVDSSLQLWEPDMPLTGADSQTIFETDGYVPNYLWAADLKTNATIKPISAIIDAGNEAHFANVQSASAVATLAGMVKTEAAIQAALSGLIASGGTADSAALAALAVQIKAVGTAESAAVATLQQQLADAQATIAGLKADQLAAAQAAAADLAK